MADVLTQADVEKLLIDAESESSTADAARSVAGGAGDGLSDGQIRALTAVHEGFSRNFARALSSLLRSTVEVKLTRVDQLKFAEFASRLNVPTCFNVLNVDPLASKWILEINPSILFPIIDRLLGGGLEPSPPVRRPLTEIELRLTARISGLFLEELRRAWRNVIDLRLAVERVESDPVLPQGMTANEMIVSISFEIAVGQSHGTMTLCIPTESIQRVGREALANMSASDADLEGERRSQQLRDGSMQLIAALADSSISTADLIGLSVGDIIATEHGSSAPILVSVDGGSKFHAQLGAVDGRKAIRIEEPLPAETAQDLSRDAAGSDAASKKT